MSPRIGISLIACLAALAACASGPTGVRGNDLARAVAEAHGVEAWSSVESLRYTFQAKLPGAEVMRRWRWDPPTGEVTLLATNDDDVPTPFTYNRRAVTNASPEAVRNVHDWFINDQYWLVFPFHLVWDSGVTLTDAGMQNLPIGEGQARQLIVAYGGDRGSTPGDVYTLYLDEDHTILEWTYNRAGLVPPISFTWRDRTEIGPIVTYLDHRREGLLDARVWFTDVEIDVAP